MTIKEEPKESGLQEKYRKHLAMRGGIFTSKTRGNLLGISMKGRRKEGKGDFRYDVRTQVKNALVDLELFIEAVENKDVNEVLNERSLKPLVEVLFSRDMSEPDLVKAEIAQLFIQTGFTYLLYMKRDLLPESFEWTIDEAVKLSKLLTELFKSDWTLRSAKPVSDERLKEIGLK